MKFKKKILKNFLTQHLLAFIGFIYISFVKISSNIIEKNTNIPQYYWDNKKPFILAFWHSQLMMINYCWKSNKKIHILASSHSDGRFGSYLGNYFNLKNIEIKSKENTTSLRPVFNILKNANYIGITPDGPRGPDKKVSEGIIKIAKSSKVPIIPVGFVSSKFKKLSSWDSFLITLPFSKCVFYWGEPIEIPSELNAEKIKEYQKLLEIKINDCILSAKNNLNV